MIPKNMVSEDTFMNNLQKIIHSQFIKAEKPEISLNQYLANTETPETLHFNKQNQKVKNWNIDRQPQCQQNQISTLFAESKIVQVNSQLSNLILKSEISFESKNMLRKGLFSCLKTKPEKGPKMFEGNCRFSSKRIKGNDSSLNVSIVKSQIANFKGIPTSLISQMNTAEFQSKIRQRENLRN